MRTRQNDLPAGWPAEAAPLIAKIRAAGAALDAALRQARDSLRPQEKVVLLAEARKLLGVLKSEAEANAWLELPNAREVEREIDAMQAECLRHGWHLLSVA